MAIQGSNPVSDGRDPRLVRSILEAADRQFVIGLDLDGVCADYSAGIRPLVAEWLGVDPDTLPEEYTYNYPEWGVSGPEQLQDVQRFGITQRELFVNLQPMEGAPAALRRLSDAGAHIRIITYRLFVPHFHEVAAAQTVKWLERYAIPYWDLCFMREKGQVGADVYIEDSPANILKLQEEGQEVIIFDNPTNQGMEGTRARSWIDVETLLMDRLWKLAEEFEHLIGPPEEPL